MKIAESGKFVELSQTLTNQLNSYAMGATAVGVGVLALTQLVDAKVVYTPANIPILVNSGTVNLDLNHDGINDFSFYNGYNGPGIPAEGNHASALAVLPAQASNRVWAVTSNKTLCAAAEPRDKTVGPKRPFQPGHSSLDMAFAWGNSISGNAGCPWLKVKQGYLGLKFVIKGKTHFGWARVKMGGLDATDYITGYAYETVVNRPIVTGKTKGPDVVTMPMDTLGGLAKGRRKTWDPRPRHVCPPITGRQP